MMQTSLSTTCSCTHCTALAQLPCNPAGQLGGACVDSIARGLVMRVDSCEAVHRPPALAHNTKHIRTQRAKKKSKHASTDCSSHALVHPVECVGTPHVALATASPPPLFVANILPYRSPRESGPQLTPGSVPCLWNWLADFVVRGIPLACMSTDMERGCILVGPLVVKHPPLMR